MADSIEMSAGSGGEAPNDGGLNELIRALSKYSTALEGVSKAIEKPDTSEADKAISEAKAESKDEKKKEEGDSAPPQEKQKESRSAPEGEQTGIRKTMADFFERNAPQAAALTSYLMPKRKPKEEQFEIESDEPKEPKKKGKKTKSEVQEKEKSVSLLSGIFGLFQKQQKQNLVTALLEDLVVIADTIAKKMGVTSKDVKGTREQRAGGGKKVKVAAPEGTPEPKGTDTVPAMLTPGEYVINADAAKKNKGTLDSINSGNKTQKKSAGGEVKYMAGGGVVGAIASGAAMAAGAPIALMEAVQSVAGKISGFVSAVNPGIVIALNQAFDDLNAVIGTALTPIMQAIVPIIKRFSSSMLPLAKTIGAAFSKLTESLMPTISILMETFDILVASVQPIIDMFADMLAMIAPLFEMLAEYVRAVFVMFGVLVTVVGALIKSLFAFDGGVGEGIKTFAETVKEMMAGLVKAFVRGIATIMKFFGFMDGVKALSGYFKRIKENQKADSTGLAAAQNASFTSLEDIGRSAAQASVIATAAPAGAEVKKSEDYYSEMIDELDGVVGNGNQTNDILADLPEKIGAAVARAISKTAEAATNAVTDFAMSSSNPLKGAGDWLGDTAAWMIYGSQK